MGTFRRENDFVGLDSALFKKAGEKEGERERERKGKRVNREEKVEA